MFPFDILAALEEPAVQLGKFMLKVLGVGIVLGWIVGRVR